MIFFNNSVKQNFKIKLDNANSVLERAVACLQPASDAYWHFYYLEQTTYRTLLVTIDDINSSLSSLMLYFEKLNQIESDLLMEFGNQQRLINKYHDEWYKFMSWYDTLLSRINLLIKEIKSIKQFHSFPELNLAYNKLDGIRRKVIFQQTEKGIKNNQI